MTTIDVYSDVICPWCYVGGRRLRQAITTVEDRTGETVQVRYHAFELNPTMPTEGLDRKAYRSAKFGSWEYSQQLDAGTISAGAPDRVVFNYDVIERTPNTRAAHRLIKLADVQGDRSAAMADRLFEAYFTEGQDVGDPDVLVTLGHDVGLTGDLASLLADPALDAEVDAEEALAEQLGMTGVPFTIVGAQGISGATSVAALVSVIEDHISSVAPVIAGQSCDLDGTCSL